MIALTCSRCERNLKVNDELAGKKVRCPLCQQTFEVPLPFSEDATVPPSGAPPREEGATIPPRWSPTPAAEPAQPSAETMVNGGAEEAEQDLAAATNYKVAGEIARGGMGAIKRAVDQDICREVAVKFLLNNADGRQRVRFVEEVQITGQLEHPNIVPIHQLGIDKDGGLFFSMKMVRGRSLADILKQRGEPGASATGGDFTLGRLLGIMISICNALAYAHARQVIHRDLKPANIMVGDFGEVYVMDWGLAKVLGKEAKPAGEVPRACGVTRITPQARSTSPAGLGDSHDKVTTRGRGAGELTQDGAIMGTPTYMPPEQAQGNLDEVDERSDIYALGAILYEMMTLTPPVGRDGDTIAILMRVVEGKIDPPAERAPERARTGWIPPELSAIALKALAKKPMHRYASVEKLKRDIELFLEGRTVSAKHDTFREMVWKLVKRNQGASWATAAAMVFLIVVVGFFLKINYAARVVAETESKKAKDAYQAYLDQVKDSVPAFVRAAKLAIHDRQFDDAWLQVGLALKSAPNDADARLLKGELLITKKRFAEAASELEECLKLDPAKMAARRLAELCRKAQGEKTGSVEETASLVAFADFFTQAQNYGLADGVLGGLDLGKNAQEVRQRLLELYRRRIDAAWPGKGMSLTLSAAGYSLKGFGEITDLAPLQWLPLSSLDLQGNRHISDLTPLKGMPLTSLSLDNCPKVRDLRPLKDMPLVSLNLDGCPEVRELGPLKGMPLTFLDLLGCGVRDLEPLKGMPMKTLYIAGTMVMDLRPLQGMQLEEILLTPRNIVLGLDILRGMKSLKAIGHSPWVQRRPAAEFWSRYDKGEFK